VSLHKDLEATSLYIHLLPLLHHFSHKWLFISQNNESWWAKIMVLKTTHCTVEHGIVLYSTFAFSMMPSKSSTLKATSFTPSPWLWHTCGKNRITKNVAFAVHECRLWRRKATYSTRCLPIILLISEAGSYADLNTKMVSRCFTTWQATWRLPVSRP
jgi:hypothetical protein